MGGDVVTRPTGPFADYTCSSKGVKAGAMRAQGFDITKLCNTGSDRVDAYIRSGARARGLPMKK